MLKRSLFLGLAAAAAMLALPAHAIEDTRFAPAVYVSAEPASVDVALVSVATVQTCTIAGHVHSAQPLTMASKSVAPVAGLAKLTDNRSTLASGPFERGWRM
jgi:hypothetical protein